MLNFLLFSCRSFVVMPESSQDGDEQCSDEKGLMLPCGVTSIYKANKKITKRNCSLLGEGWSNVVEKSSPVGPKGLAGL
jgi:hypothetical protein